MSSFLFCAVGTRIFTLGKTYIPMKRVLMTLLVATFSLTAVLAQKKMQADHYMVRIYHCSDLQQVARIEEYTGKQLLPFLHKQGVKHVGIFMPLNNDTLTDKKLMVWIPLTSLDQMTRIEKQFESLDPWGKDPLARLDSANGKPPYNRIEISFSSAFRDMTRYQPSTSFKRSPDNVYEYRSYESSTEGLHLGKVHMFNEGGEVPLFQRLDFNALFYARVIAGPRMPNLIYMTRFADMPSRTAHWKAFGDDPQWKKLVADPKYQGNVSRNETILMRASQYSDL